MRIARFLAPLVVLPLILVAGCGRGTQSDLKVTEAKFATTEGGKARLTGRVENTGQNTYSSVFVVVDAYENEDFVKRLETSANLPGGIKLAPGATTTFDKQFDDGGFKPNRYELVRLYAIQ